MATDTRAALAGVFVPLITPFDAAGEVDRDALQSLARECLDAGAAGLVALGTTAEPASLTAAEQRAVVDVVAGVCRKRGAALLVGAGTEAALDALRGRPEVTAALSVVPAFARPGEAGVVAHFAALAAASPVPLVVYHVPYRTAQPLSAAAILRLAALPGVLGMKYASGALDAETVALAGALPKDFALLCGDDVLLAPMLALGASGGILASAHLATAGFVDLVDAWRAGEGGTARTREPGHRLARMSAALFAEPNPTVIKGVLHARGRIASAAVRLPLLPAAPASVEAALRAVAETEHTLDAQRTNTAAAPLAH